jgi:hypothetical protein
VSRWALLLLLLACGCSTPPPLTPRPPSTVPPLFTISERACGPLTPASPATLVALRAAFAGYDVAPINTSDSLEYRVTQRGATRILDVIPDDAGTILDVFILSPDIAIDRHAWRVGAPFTLEQTTTCECWGEQTVCFRDGDHIAVALARVCREGALATPAARNSLAGTPIRTVIWSARPLAPGGYASAPAPAADDE